jgi:hypothetical protein
VNRRAVRMALVLVMTSAPLGGQTTWDAGRPDAQAPVGVPYGHLLIAGEVTIGYRYDFAHFSHLRQDTERVGAGAALGLGYQLEPESMNAHRHVVELMYATTDQITVLAELPYVHRSMTSGRSVGPATDRTVSGFGDLRLGALLEVLNHGSRRAHFNLLVGIPTGPAAERDEQGALAYAQQPGAGTVHVRPTLTFTEQETHKSWGAQLGGALFLGESGEGHTMGNRLDMTAWGAWRVLSWASVSGRVAGEFWGDVQHSVAEFPATPAAEPGFTGGQRVDLLAGANLQAAAGVFQGHRLFFEVGLPVHQKLDGPQLGMSWRGEMGWRWAVGQP